MVAQYRYDAVDQRMVDERARHYRDQSERYLAGRLTEDQFRPLRLKNGLYVQRLAPMLRVAIPYGTLSSRQLRKLAAIARDYDKGYGHFSTRQNIQFNWPLLAEVPDILAELAGVQMHAIQTSGNCIRNVTADHFSGIAPDEVADARPVCELIRQWSTAHPEFDWLPRKFKIAVNGAGADRAASDVHDIGIDLVHHDGTIACNVKVGGGLGRTPAVAALVREHLPLRHLLSYLEACLRVYNRYGRRDNKYKARIKILVRAFGVQGFRDRVDAEWEHLRDGPSTLTDAEIERVHAHFTGPELPRLPDVDLGAERLASPAFSRWLDHNVHAHRQPGHAAVTISLKQTGNAPGDASDEDMDLVAELADRFSHGEIRVSHEQNLVLPYVRQQDLRELWQLLDTAWLATPNVGTLTNIICCPGGDYCSLANAKSIPIAEAIQRRFDDLDYVHDLGPIDLNISGCMNACGHHHVGHIGILGVDKKGEEFYQVSIGGHAGTGASIGEILGPSFYSRQVPDVIEQLIEVFVEHRRDGETFLDVTRRIGVEPFRQRVYAAPHHP
jgi:sulfite reductase (NADPH) hemoprotein beta-component